jgi:hypothetical protein
MCGSSRPKNGWHSLYQMKTLNETRKKQTKTESETESKTINKK